MLSTTPARAQFKRHLGHANHYLVTALVALHALDAGDTSAAPAELRTSWNPKDKHASVVRTRVFVIQSFLGWAVDSIDLYLSLLNRKPKFLQNSSLVSRLDGAGRSVFQKAMLVGEHFSVHPAVLALTAVLITWRNNVFHELAENEVGEQARAALIEHAAFISSTYRHLDSRDLAAKAEAGASLTFKEAASLINAAHHFVETIDERLLRVFDHKAFCVEAVFDAVNDRDNPRFARKFLGLPDDKRRRFVFNWLRNEFGFVAISEAILDGCVVVRRAAD